MYVVKETVAVSVNVNVKSMPFVSSTSIAQSQTLLVSTQVIVDAYVGGAIHAKTNVASSSSRDIKMKGRLFRFTGKGSRFVAY